MANEQDKDSTVGAVGCFIFGAAAIAFVGALITGDNAGQSAWQVIKYFAILIGVVGIIVAIANSR